MATTKHYGRKPPFEVNLTPEQVKRAEQKLAEAQNDAPQKTHGTAEKIKNADSSADTANNADKPLTGKQGTKPQDKSPANQ